MGQTITTITRNPQHVIIAKMHVIFSKKMQFTENIYFIEAKQKITCFSCMLYSVQTNYMLDWKITYGI